MLWIVAVVALTCLLGLASLLALWSMPGRPRPFLDPSGRPVPGSLSEKIRVPINGMDQGMLIKTRSEQNPVLLYLHGGMPDYFLERAHPSGLDELFSVCWWEQRGSGLSYTPEVELESLSVELLIRDTLAVTDYLRRRFDQPRIYLMGHSGGTFLGVQAVARAPERFSAYIGVAQVSHQLQSEKLAYDYMLEQYKRRGNERMVHKLEAAPVTLSGGVPKAYLAVRDAAMHELGVGTTHDMRSVLSGIFLSSLRCPDYSLGEKLNLWRGKAAAGVSCVWDEMLATDLSQRVPELGVPVYFFHGIHDYTCSYPQAAAYLASLKAPLKGFYSFSRSAHSPIFEEPSKVQQILREDVLTASNRLADRT